MRIPQPSARSLTGQVVRASSMFVELRRETESRKASNVCKAFFVLRWAEEIVTLCGDATITADIPKRAKILKNTFYLHFVAKRVVMIISASTTIRVTFYLISHQ